MKAIEFEEVNVRIAEGQSQYETLPAHFERDRETNGFFLRVTMCFELDKQELEQIAKTGKIWQTVLVPNNTHFHPIRMSVLKPEMGETKKQLKG